MSGLNLFMPDIFILNDSNQKIITIVKYYIKFFRPDFYIQKNMVCNV